MKPLQLAQLLAFSELSSALLVPSAYTFMFRYDSFSGSWQEPVQLLGPLLGILFVVVPAATFFGLLKGWLLAFWGLYLSPALSFLFGVSAVPFVMYASPAGSARTVLLVLTNVAAIALAVWIRTRLRTSWGVLMPA